MTNNNNKKEYNMSSSELIVEPIVEPIVEKVIVPPKKNYLNNKDILAQVALSKQRSQMTNELALMLQTLTKRYAKKGNFANYSYNDDMQAYALLMLCKTWASFDENKSNNPFAFFTQCIKNSFIQYLNQERRVRDIKDRSLVEHGFNPSFNYILEHEGDYHEKREAMMNGEIDDYTREVVTFAAPVQKNEDVDTEESVTAS
jgi:DNA-directed RNA polymerase specialized sigma24 family protein